MSVDRKKWMVVDRWFYNSKCGQGLRKTIGIDMQTARLRGEREGNRTKEFKKKVELLLVVSIFGKLSDLFS